MYQNKPAWVALNCLEHIFVLVCHLQDNLVCLPSLVLFKYSAWVAMVTLTPPASMAFFSLPLYSTPLICRTFCLHNQLHWPTSSGGAAAAAAASVGTVTH